MNPNPSFLVEFDPVNHRQLESILQIKRQVHPPFLDITYILVILSSKPLPYSLRFLREKIGRTYSKSVVFFQNTQADAVGVSAPKKVDLIFDCTGSNERQCFFLPRKWKKMTRFIVGIKSTSFRKRRYDRLWDESALLQSEWSLERDSQIYESVFALGGVYLF